MRGSPIESGCYVNVVTHLLLTEMPNLPLPLQNLFTFSSDQGNLLDELRIEVNCLEEIRM